MIDLTSFHQVIYLVGLIFIALSTMGAIALVLAWTLDKLAWLRKLKEYTLRGVLCINHKCDEVRTQERQKAKEEGRRI